MLLGPRQTGKSSFLRHQMRADRTFDLLLHSTFSEISRRPSLLRESLQPHEKIIIIDEIQKLPVLMDEIHHMIEEMGKTFILTGSSARKLRRSNGSLLAGRLRSLYFHPLVSAEIPDFQLEQVLSFGTLPGIYLSTDPSADLRDYVGDYLQQEIQAEALARSIDSYSRFLSQAGTCNAKVINFEKLASDAQLSPSTVRRYVDVLTDTLIAKLVEPWKQTKRKAISAPKLYFFDVGVANTLVGVNTTNELHPGFGDQFETFIFNEIFAYRDYKKRDTQINYWRTYDQTEVDMIINDSIAIEIKATRLATEHDTKGLKRLSEDASLKRQMIVSRDTQRRRLGDIEIIPYKQFLQDLWAGELV